MARLAVEWQEPTLGSYEGYNPDSLLSALPADLARSGKPTVVYVFSDLPEDAVETANLGGTLLTDERVALGLKLFNLVKVRGETITKTHPYASILGGRELPRMVVVGADGSRVGALEGNDATPSAMMGLMKRASAKAYKTPIETFIKDYQKVLTDLDKVEGAKKTLATKRATSGEVAKSKSLGWDREEQELAKQEGQILEREKVLTAGILPKGEKVAKAN